ncbi:MAG: L-seryl-tRNA(Sec) selenium transferase [Coriobacteriia bacterium]|nr:L-seryl-tRNA(Sec) selenium transferase [Coriobacteriia bacterium]
MTQPASPTKQELYQSLPNIDQVMNTPEVESLLLEGIARSIVLDAVRDVLEEARTGIADGSVASLYDLQTCVTDILPHIEAALQPSLHPVVNATGIVVHTNLGRSVLPSRARTAVNAINEGYCNLEYSTDCGMRGSRHDHIEKLLCELTGAEAAMAVNNNAAAVLLTLATLAGDCDTIVSRGQMVEIGGSFRIPDVMAASGTNMIEVGTTNKTHTHDYRKAVEAARTEERQVGLLFKAHTSNYRVTGFSSDVSLKELTQLGQEMDVLVAEDLGSGVLVDLTKFGLPHEPTVQESLASGADVITFSGDKLLGGPQAGILCGKAEVIERLKKHPLARAVRLDKMSLAALEATLSLYRDLDQAIAEIPTLRMLSMTTDECRELAIDLAVAIQAILEREGHAEGSSTAHVVKDESFAGGGSLPDVELPSYAVALRIEGMSASELERRLRKEGEIPIIGRIKDDHVLLAVRTLSAEDFAVILAELEILLAHTR